MKPVRNGEPVSDSGLEINSAAWGYMNKLVMLDFDHVREHFTTNGQDVRWFLLVCMSGDKAAWLWRLPGRRALDGMVAGR